MKELIEKLFAELPSYANRILEILTGPKRFVARQNLSAPDATRKALTFLAISFGLAYIAQIPFLPENQNKELMFGVLAIQCAFAFILNVAVTILSWKVVGARPDFTRFLAATCYFCGVSTLLFTGIWLLAAGAFNILDPTHYQQMVAGTILGTEDLTFGYTVYLIILGVAFLATYAWIFCVWGTYRVLTKLSKWHSGAAYAVFLTLTPLVFALQLLMGATVTPLHRSPLLPPDLVGTWQTTRTTNSADQQFPELVLYNFNVSTDHLFSYNYLTVKDVKYLTHGHCTRLVTGSQLNSVKVEGSALTLTPFSFTEINDDSCTGQSSQTKSLKTAAEVYQYQIHQQPSGAELCLTNRFGQLCLAPKR